MSSDNSNWEDIPSLKDLEIDWDFEPESSMGKRVYSRLTIDDLHQLFNNRDFPVKLVSARSQCKAFIVDISQGGVCLRTILSHFEDLELVKFGFILGEHKVISRGRIKHIRKENEWTVLGIEFVGLAGENEKFIGQLYSSAKFKCG